MLTVSGLVKKFGGFTAVNDVSFAVAEGEILGLIGPNGSGKSTIFNCIAGMYAPTAGSIMFAGQEIAGLGATRICHRGIGRTYQIPRPFRNLSLLENVALSAWFGQDAKVTRRDCWRQAEEALAMVGLPSDARARTDGLGPRRSRSSSSRARWRRSRASCSPTRASTASTTPRWTRPRRCSSASAARRGSPSSGSSTSWAC